MKAAFCIIIAFLTCCLQASVIPPYEIGGVNENMITFTNDAIFQVLSRDFVTSQPWQPGDEVKITSMEVGLVVSVVQYTLSPVFLLDNLTRTEKRIAVSLQKSPTVPHQYTYTINAIDFEAQAIELSDASVWRYPMNNQRHVAVWRVGDVIMIGVNSLGSSTVYDAILINTDKQSVIKALQQ